MIDPILVQEGLSITWRGAWVSATAYSINDAVASGGSAYICILATSGTTAPSGDATHWSLLASVGAAGTNGTNGTNGATGPAGPNHVGTATDSLAVALNVSRTFNTQPGCAFFPGNRIRATSSGTPASWMEGLVQSYNNSSGALVIAIDAIGTIGTHADWLLNLGNALPTGAIFADTSGIASIDAQGRSLRNTSGTHTVNWGTQLLFDTFSSNYALDWHNRQLLNTSGTKTVDWQNGQLLNASAISVDWHNYSLANSAGTGLVLWDNPGILLVDSVGNLAVDVDVRWLFDVDGVTPVAQWGNGDGSFAVANFYCEDIRIDGQVVYYNSQPVVGIPVIRAQLNLLSQTAALSTTTLYEDLANDKAYRLSVSLQITTPGTTSKLGGTTGVVITFTDNAVSHSINVPLFDQSGVPIVTATGNTNNTNLTISNGQVEFHAAWSVPIQIAIGYTSTGTPMQFKVSVRLEDLG